MMETATLEPGVTLQGGRYRVERLLGQGGMGSVYLATMPALGDKPFAIKEMKLAHLALREREAAEAQFRLEAQLLANLDHPNLVHVSDFFEESGRLYLVMAYVRGHTLAELLEQRGEAFFGSEVVDWGLQLARTLGYLHTRNPPILFRDLKPSNIMLDDQGRIRLIDFGIARAFVPEGRTAAFVKGMGSAGYSPLEQYQGGDTTDPRSDIYSLGATLYHLVTNQAPLSPVDLMSERTTQPPARRWKPDIPIRLEGLLQSMLALKKDGRIASMAAVEEALNGIATLLPPVRPTQLLAPASTHIEVESTEQLGTAALAGRRSIQSDEAGRPPSPLAAAATRRAMGADERALWAVCGILTLALCSFLVVLALRSNTPAASLPRTPAMSAPAPTSPTRRPSAVPTLPRPAAGGETNALLRSAPMARPQPATLPSPHPAATNSPPSAATKATTPRTTPPQTVQSPAVAPASYPQAVRSARPKAPVLSPPSQTVPDRPVVETPAPPSPASVPSPTLSASPRAGRAGPPPHGEHPPSPGMVYDVDQKSWRERLPSDPPPPGMEPQPGGIRTGYPGQNL